MTRQQEIFNQAETLNKEAIALVSSAKTFDDKVAEINMQAEEVRAVGANAAAVGKQVADAGKLIQDYGLPKLQRELIQARSIAFFILREKQQAEVDVFDPTDLTGRQRYRILVNTTNLDGSSVALRVRVHELWSDTWHAEDATPLMVPNRSYALKDAPGLIACDRDDDAEGLSLDLRGVVLEEAIIPVATCEVEVLELVEFPGLDHDGKDSLRARARCRSLPGPPG
jgi:hypothetical protein